MTSVAYLVNQYPKVSHSFIRREIRALERLNFRVSRFAVRGWDAEVVDEEDRQERDRTRYLLRSGAVPLAKAVGRALLRDPARFFRALGTALRLGLAADRPLPVHAIYFAEACLVVDWCAAEGIDHLHAHFGTNPAEVALLAHVLGGPSYSFTVHGPEEFDKPTFLHLPTKIRHAAFVVAISSYGRSQLYRWADQRDWSRIQVVHCGLETDFHDVAPRPVPIEPRLVSIGRLDAEKGHLVLVEAARLLAQRGRDFSLVLIGDGELRPAIEQAIAKAGLGSRIRLAGWQTAAAVRDALLASRALVMASFAEGLPVVCMEAMALRRPVLATAIAGIPELVRNGVDGLLYPAGDAGALADALERFLSMPGADVERMGEAGRARVLERHSIDTEAARLAELFESVVRRESAAPTTTAEAVT